MRTPWTVSARETRLLHLLGHVGVNMQTLAEDMRQTTVTPAMKSGQVPQLVAAPFVAAAIGVLNAPEAIAKGLLGIRQQPLRPGESFLHREIDGISQGLRTAVTGVLSLDPKAILQGAGRVVGGTIGAIGAPIADTLAAPFNYSTAA